MSSGVDLFGVLSFDESIGVQLIALNRLTPPGYNFKSLKDITPFLEPTAAGISSLWARTTALKYGCVVTVGYPEKVDITATWPWLVLSL